MTFTWSYFIVTKSFYLHTDYYKKSMSLSKSSQEQKRKTQCCPIQKIDMEWRYHRFNEEQTCGKGILNFTACRYFKTYINLYHWFRVGFGLVGSMSTSHTVGREFASRQGHTKDHHKNGTNCLPAMQGRSLTVQPDCLRSWVVCGTVYGDMHLKDLLGSIVRVGYHIPILDFYLVLHGLRCRKSTIID